MSVLGALVQKVCSGSPLCGPIPFPDVMYYMAAVVALAAWAVFQLGLYYRRTHPVSPRDTHMPDASSRDKRTAGG